LEMTRKRIEARQFARELGVNGDRYGVVTLHRPSNVDDAAQLSTLVEMLRAIAEKLPIVFPVHPRTRKRLQNFGFWGRIEGAQGVRLIEPVGYVEFMSLVFGAKAVITDSGGVQEETTYLGIPCITLRENTERPITVLEGTNRLMQPAGVPAALEIILQGNWQQGNRPELWDGNTAGRVVESLKKHVNNLA
jgi:UDP-N-acetylglucosamine 2-epimerase (non-hydrolysing)